MAVCLAFKLGLWSWLRFPFRMTSVAVRLSASSSPGSGSSGWNTRKSTADKSTIGQVKKQAIQEVDKSTWVRIELGHRSVRWPCLCDRVVSQHGPSLFELFVNDSITGS